eukprot:scaffold496563_cov49-Prasinocladus_malaysianus.AAC.1
MVGGMPYGCVLAGTGVKCFFSSLGRSWLNAWHVRRVGSNLAEQKSGPVIRASSSTSSNCAADTVPRTDFFLVSRIARTRAGRHSHPQQAVITHERPADI